MRIKFGCGVTGHTLHSKQIDQWCSLMLDLTANESIISEYPNIVVSHMSLLANPYGELPANTGVDLAGSLPIFPSLPGDSLPTSLPIGDFRQKRLLFNRLGMPGQIHIYNAECVAGERLFAHLFVPVLPLGGAVVPAFAIVAQSLPYSADVRKLPFELPAGFSAVVASPPSDLMQPVEDVLTRVRYYPGPSIDTRTLVGGRCYVVVWSPNNHMGKYVLQVGHRWPLRAGYWLSVPAIWWRIRGWFGLSRAAAAGVGAGLLVAVATVASFLRRRRKQVA